VPFVNETRTLLAADGIEIPCVSGGGTPRMWQAHQWKGITEHRAGTYVYGDRKTVSVGAMSFDEVAMHVLTTVVSRPTADRGILDAGSKVLSSDTLDLDGFGYILEYPEARIYAQSEEHGHVDFSQCSSRPEVGEKVTVIPNHTCVVTNLTDEVVWLRDGKFHDVWAVAARGMVREAMKCECESEECSLFSLLFQHFHNFPPRFAAGFHQGFFLGVQVEFDDL